MAPRRKEEVNKGTLDQFFGSKPSVGVATPKPAKQNTLLTDERCCVCKKDLHGQDQYKLEKKGKTELYCRAHFKAKMRPLEEVSEL